eukprot:Nitzschia sp. Nitz4//scaffold356_size15932//10402//11757//NITZ4_008881-RA/size15932-processed-gene-0.13-mRNA-1//-1//CDS//3329548970//3715//frame0
MNVSKQVKQRRPKTSSVTNFYREENKHDHEAAKGHLPSRRHRRSISWTTLGLLVCLTEVFLWGLYSHSDWVLQQVGISAQHNFEKVTGPIVREFIGNVSDLKDTGNDTATLQRTSSALGYSPFPPIQHTQQDFESRFQHPSKVSMGINYTLQVMESMGINRSDVIDRGLWYQVPPWWQVVENFGDGEPIILGLERCETFRERVRRRHVAPAGMFSTGTNLLQQLLADNCISPLKGQKARMLTLWQVPWGKHNPVAARLRHIAIHMADRNQSAVLPVVTVRHPYTWLHAVCAHPYSFKWDHRPEFCDRSLFLKYPVEANHGARRSHIPGIPDTYDSLIHAWRDWNLEYLENNDFPLLVIRFEDLVYRPKQVIEKVCGCVGGTVHEPFWYLREPANLGEGHGKSGRSDLLSAMVKYGMPLELYHQMYSELDWSIIKSTLADDHGLMRALGYKL